MPKPRDDNAYLSPREQQVMELVYRSADGLVAADVEKALGLSNSAARTFLRILEQKGHLTHTEADGRYVYHATRPRESAAAQALSRVVRTFFNGSPTRVMATLLSQDETKLSADELAELQALIDRARQEEGR
jgi:Predicted transcriptional regulator